MKNILRITTLLICVIAFIGFTTPKEANAQGLRLVSTNTLAGATTGATLGFATMALQDQENWRYLNFGVGFGTIGGLGIGIYDLVLAGGSGYYVDGLFTSASSTTSIIFLDTFYGAATGSIVGGAIALMTGDPILRGMQYGAGTGAWIGFAFGLVDAFVFSDHVPADDLFDQFASNENTARGIITYSPSKNLSFGAVYPTVYSYMNFTDLSNVLGFATGVELTNLKFSF